MILLYVLEFNRPLWYSKQAAIKCLPFGELPLNMYNDQMNKLDHLKSSHKHVELDNGFSLKLYPTFGPAMADYWLAEIHLDCEERFSIYATRDNDGIEMTARNKLVVEVEQEIERLRELIETLRKGVGMIDKDPECEGALTSQYKQVADRYCKELVALTIQKKAVRKTEAEMPELLNKIPASKVEKLQAFPKFNFHDDDDDDDKFNFNHTPGKIVVMDWFEPIAFETSDRCDVAEDHKKNHKEIIKRS